MNKVIEDKLKQFIEDNELDLRPGSGIPLGIIAIIGFYMYIEMSHPSDYSELLEFLDDESDIDMTDITDDEFKASYESAYTNSYGDWWKSPEAEKQYNF